MPGRSTRLRRGAKVGPQKKGPGPFSAFFLTLADLGTLADGIVAQSGGSVTHVELGLERSWIPYLLLVVLLTAEWLLRRRVHVV